MVSQEAMGVAAVMERPILNRAHAQKLEQLRGIQAQRDVEVVQAATQVSVCLTVYVSVCFPLTYGSDGHSDDHRVRAKRATFWFIDK